MVDPQSSQAEAVTELPSEVPVPGFQVEAPEDAQHYPIPADDWRPDAWPQHIQGGSSDIGSESLVGNWPGGVIPSVGGYTGNLPGYDPVYFPEPPPDRVQQALDEIAGLYGLDRFRPTGHSNPAASSIWTNPAANDAPGADAGARQAHRENSAGSTGARRRRDHQSERSAGRVDYQSGRTNASVQTGSSVCGIPNGGAARGP